jgi:hypothetical protein
MTKFVNIPICVTTDPPDAFVHGKLNQMEKFVNCNDLVRATCSKMQRKWNMHRLRTSAMPEINP